MFFGLLSASHDVGRELWLEGSACRRVEIEIGPGNCGYLLEAARRYPATLYVGIEIQIGTVARVRRRGVVPPNVRLIDNDGGWIVKNLLAPACVDAFHVYFPDPWWKKRHQKRRLFQPDFCSAIARTLAPGGAVYVVTDVIPLFSEICRHMQDAGFRREPWQRTADDVACSAYEKKYRRQGRHFETAIFRL